MRVEVTEQWLEFLRQQLRVVQRVDQEDVVCAIGNGYRRIGIADARRGRGLVAACQHDRASQDQCALQQSPRTMHTERR